MTVHAVEVVTMLPSPQAKPGSGAFAQHEPNSSVRLLARHRQPRRRVAGEVRGIRGRRPSCREGAA